MLDLITLICIICQTCLLENCRTYNIVAMSDYFEEGGNTLYEIEGFMYFFN